MSQRIDLPWGYLELDTNEVSLVSTVADPPAVRLAAIDGLSLGKCTFNRMRPDGRQVETVLIQGKQDERTRDNPASYAGEVTVHISDGGDSDGAMRLVCTMRHDVVIFHVPVRPAGGVF